MCNNNMTNLTFFQLKEFTSMKKEMTGVEKGSRERNLTWTMFCVVTLYILSNTHFFSNFLIHTNYIGEKTYFILRPIYSLLFVVNSSANLFIYLYFNNKFRDHFISIFSCTPTNNEDAIKQTAVFYQNTNEEVLE